MRSIPILFAHVGHSLVASTMVLVLSLCPATLLSQSADTTLFRPGQWGVEFVVGGSNALGVMRFSTPTRAWIGNLSGELQSANNDLPQGGTRSVRAVDLRLGNRWFRPLTSDLVQHVTLGALAGVRRTEREFNNNSFVDRSMGAGVFADLGAQWMVTRNLSLGASYGLTASASRQTNVQPSDERKGTTTIVMLGPVGIRAALYF